MLLGNTMFCIIVLVRLCTEEGNEKGMRQTAKGQRSRMLSRLQRQSIFSFSMLCSAPSGRASAQPYTGKLKRLLATPVLEMGLILSMTPPGKTHAQLTIKQVSFLANTNCFKSTSNSNRNDKAQIQRIMF